MIGRAFCPGHITGFFEIRDNARDPLQKGSRGAGVSLSLGVLTTVTVEERGPPSLEVLLNGRPEDARTTRRAAGLLLGGRELQVKVESEVQLPVGQGLGMSAAGALSTSLALAKALGLSRMSSQAGEAAHRAEVEERTGLGDVPAQARGGWEIRVRPGFPPHGFVERFNAPPTELLTCVAGEPLPTKSVLSDKARREAVNRAGTLCISRMLEVPTVESFFELSYKFARNTGLVSPSALELAGEVRSRKLGLASVSMIGNSVFATGRTAEIRDLFKDRGQVFSCRADTEGARVV